MDEIWEYIAADSIDAADPWIGKLFEAFEALSQNPGIGHKREDLTAYPVLFWPVGSYSSIPGGSMLATRNPGDPGDAYAVFMNSAGFLGLQYVPSVTAVWIVAFPFAG